MFSLELVRDARRDISLNNWMQCDDFNGT